MSEDVKRMVKNGLKLVRGEIEDKGQCFSCMKEGDFERHFCEKCFSKMRPGDNYDEYMRETDKMEIWLKDRERLKKRRKEFREKDPYAHLRTPKRSNGGG